MLGIEDCAENLGFKNISLNTREPKNNLFLELFFSVAIISETQNNFH